MAYPQLEDLNAYQQAIIHTNHGDIQLALFADQAPKTVENFIELAKQGYYDGVIFHRVIPDFMIQGGDPTGTGMGGESIYGQKFADEFSLELFNLNGALSMANAGPNTNGSQFFIVSAKEVPAPMLGQLEAGGWPKEIVAAYEEKGGTPWLDQRHTVFGQVVTGLDTVYEIEQVERNSQDKPLEDVIIERITIVE
ncbi:peptidylprolyl isomerase [Aerococcus urinaehominis]|uniref:Peptidyl-prolyl cis-trans isomerase n=1 Tax=Aerococcus urinaehominis TaxID=128944 RepID=A0A109RI73_9LACT|nr:peptidylprolyl isomerase [Aerococcus urinaehominis]AMB99730.1 peptidylprolyl isomerase [Aerococcus urinaehominis]SDL92206.1 peptidyl-prolyl cis-trans isomerase B (cyclophilin B) [Aerococcus urinaehominis]